MRRILTALLMLLVLTPPTPARAAVNPYANKVVFAQSGDLWTCSPTGTSRVRITSGPAVDSLPRWSADHRYVYFVRDTGDSQSIWVTYASGTASRQIYSIPKTTGAAVDQRFTSVVLSPDRRHLYALQHLDVTTEGRTQGKQSRVIRINLATKAVTTVFSTAASTSRDSAAHDLDVTSDGTMLVFLEGDDAARMSLYRLTLTSARVVRLASPPGYNTWVSARLDGSNRLLYSAANASATPVPYRMGRMTLTRTGIRSIGTNTRLVTRVEGVAPNGLSLLVGRRPASSGLQDLYTVPISGGTTRRIATYVSSADW